MVVTTQVIAWQKKSLKSLLFGAFTQPMLWNFTGSFPPHPLWWHHSYVSHPSFAKSYPTNSLLYLFLRMLFLSFPLCLSLHTWKGFKFTPFSVPTQTIPTSPKNLRVLAFQPALPSGLFWPLIIPRTSRVLISYETTSNVLK